MKASDYIAQRIAKEGVKKVFGYQGGNISHTIDSISNNPNLQFISTYNEQGAAFAACGYALENETIGVALASSGPGAVNLVSGIANAYYDSIPTLFITGNVSTHTMKTSECIRQNAFQENDIVSMVSKITKYSVTIKDIHKLKYYIDKALYFAQEGRPGPVLLDLPHNIQKLDIDFDNEVGFKSENKSKKMVVEDIDSILTIIHNSKRPLIVVGGGACYSSVRKVLKQILNIWKIPVVSTLRGLDVVSHDYDYFLGFGGAYGIRTANLSLKYADTILVLGARLDERFICLDDKSVFENKRIVHVDIDEIELGRVIENEIKIQMDLSSFLKKLLSKELKLIECSKWRELVNSWKKRYLSINDEWSPNKVVYELTSSLNCTTITIDVGLNQMSVAQSVVLKNNQKCITSSGYGAMGCSIPFAIGAAYASNKIINCFIGDGALHMNIQELLVLSRDNLPIHVILNNNQCLGMIRDFQRKIFNSRFTGTTTEFHNIDYAQIAKAYNLRYCRVESLNDLNKAKSYISSEKPCFVELCFMEDVDTNPRLGTDMFTQIPILDEDEYKRIEEEISECENTIY